ncbi:MAG: hypothetical protein LQ350_006761 [Teloschistes chrysophthalmus]|nr:MAG: hypothetical protein LQ350_006761 [Niorma chrysophthalma]
MAPPSSRKPHPPAAQPRRTIFDPWNSSSTGHQRAENRLSGSTSWRASRTMKLASQFKAGASGGRRLYDSVGAGSEHFGKDGRKDNGGWEKGAPGLREKGWRDVRGLLHRSNDNGVEDTDVIPERDQKRRRISPEEPASTLREEEVDSEPPPAQSKEEKKIFDGLCVFINGSTAPMVGDHRLKQILAENGAQVSIALGRRSVTHVILGTPNGSAHGKGAGGGLAATKIQKEIQRVGGKGVKYVGVEWVLESLKVGKRLPEARFSNITLAQKGQKSVYAMFSKEQSLESVESANGPNAAA